MDKLLLIDDEDDVRYSFKRIFESPDLDLETAASGEEGLEVIKSFQPDLVLMDVRMGGITGLETLRRIHEEDGRMVIANLHTLDTARRYCDRVIGMRDGRIVFDGTPAQLTTGVARDIYGADDSFSEDATSTEIRDAARPAITARATATA